MARHKLITALLNDNIRIRIDQMSEKREVVHAIGLVFVKTFEWCDEQTRLDLLLTNGGLLLECAQSMQEDMDEIRQMILDAIEDKEQSAASEREKAS